MTALNSLIPPDAGWTCRRPRYQQPGPDRRLGASKRAARGFMLTPYPVVVDLRGRTGPAGGEVKLRWMAPYGEGDQPPSPTICATARPPSPRPPGPARIRSHVQPAIGQPGTPQLHTEAQMTPGVRWYFAIKHPARRRTRGRRSPMCPRCWIGLPPADRRLRLQQLRGQPGERLHLWRHDSHVRQPDQLCATTPAAPASPARPRPSGAELVLSDGHRRALRRNEHHLTALLQADRRPQRLSAGRRGHPRPDAQANSRSNLTFYQLRQFDHPVGHLPQRSRSPSRPRFSSPS